MLSWLKTRLRNFVRGKPITEDYTGKVVKASRSYIVGDGEGGTWRKHKWCLITVLWDDGKYNIAGPVFKEQDAYSTTPVNSKTGLFHARKGYVAVVADSVAEYKEAKRIRETRARCQQSVCSNEAGEVGIVTDYDGITFTGRTLKGSPWEAKDLKCLATSYKDYTERCLDE